MPANVPITGKIGKAAPNAKSGSSSGPDCGPMPDDTASGESMHDPMPPPHFSASGVQRRAAAFQAQKEMSDQAQNGG